MISGKRRPKPNPPTKVWIGPEEYDSTMEGIHQVMFNDMGVQAKHHPSVPVNYCEPDFVTNDWEYDAPLYIESKDDFYQANLMHSIKFGREMNVYVYYMGAIHDPKDLYDVCDQAITKAYREGNHGFRQFWLYHMGMKEYCGLPMVSKNGKLKLVPLKKEYNGSHWALDECFTKYDIDVDKTLYAYQHSTSFTDWDAIQRPDDEEPIFKEGNKIMNATIMDSNGQGMLFDPVKTKRTRKHVESPVPHAENDSITVLANKAMREIGLDPDKIRCKEAVVKAYRKVGGNKQMFQAIFRPFFSKDGKVRYVLLNRNLITGLSEFLAANWDHIDCTWYERRMRCEIYSAKGSLAKSLKGKGTEERIAIFVDRYNAQIRKNSGVIPLPVPSAGKKKATKRTVTKPAQTKKPERSEDETAVLVPVCSEFAQRMDRLAREKHESKTEISRRLINAIDKMGYFN